jgi:hypothetical protein
VEVDVEVQVGVMPNNVTVHYECTNTDTDIDLQSQSSKEKTTRCRFASQAGMREYWFVLCARWSAFSLNFNQQMNMQSHRLRREPEGQPRR